MSSLILQTTSRVLQPLMLFVSVFLLLRGHNDPGGGFVGGLLATSAYALHMIAFGIESARRSLPLEPRSLIAAGALLALASALAPLALGRPLFSALWLEVHLPRFGLVALGSPLAFDLGVYLLVVGSSLTALFALEEESA